MVSNQLKDPIKKVSGLPRAEVTVVIMVAAMVAVTTVVVALAENTVAVTAVAAITLAVVMVEAWRGPLVDTWKPAVITLARTTLL